jgi:NADH:ubiquinone reductase (H+-translocating)
MAMVGLDAAVAEMGPWHFPIFGPLAFVAWLGLHAVLLTTVRAETETLLEWAWNYIGGTRVSPILDQQVELPKPSTE